MIIIKTKIEEHWSNRDGDMATIISRQDGATLNLMMHDGQTFAKDYTTRRGAAVAMHHKARNMRFVCMTDHLEVKKDAKGENGSI